MTALDEGKRAIWWNRFWRRATMTSTILGILLFFASLLFLGFWIATLIGLLAFVIERVSANRWNWWRKELDRCGKLVKEEDA
jgi:hypothetical protein